VRHPKALFGRWISRQDVHVLDVLRGASIAGVLKVLSAVFTFGLSVALGRMLGAEEAGIYFLALTTATIAATVGRLGLDSAVIRFVSAGSTRNSWGEVRAVYRSTIAIGLTSSVVVVLGLILTADYVAGSVFEIPRLSGPIRLMAIAVVPLALNILISRALQGLSQIRDSVLVFSILPSGIALFGTLLLARRLGVEGAIAAYVVGVTASAIYGEYAWRRSLAKRANTKAPLAGHSATTDLLRSGPPLLIGALLQLVVQMTGTLMLGIWADTRDVSIFAVAWRTAILINFVLIAVNAIAQPKFAELYARRDMVSLANTARKANILMTAFAAPVFLVFLVAPEFVMSAFGSDFSGGGAVLQILSVGQFVNVATGSVGILLVMSGHEREYRNIQIVAACVVVGLSCALIPALGATGAAIGAAAALIVQNVLFGYFVWTKLGILLFIRKSVVQRDAGDP
jgi:O-antigen/teichoic acid export membrane protein